MSARNGSQIFLRLEVASVEMIPKLISSAARTGAIASVTATDVTINARSMLCLLASLLGFLVSAYRSGAPGECVDSGGSGPRRRSGAAWAPDGTGLTLVCAGVGDGGHGIDGAGRQHQFRALRTVKLVEECPVEGALGPVIDDAAVAQGDGARAVGQRVLDLVQRDEH